MYVRHGAGQGGATFVCVGFHGPRLEPVGKMGIALTPLWKICFVGVGDPNAAWSPSALVVHAVLHYDKIPTKARKSSIIVARSGLICHP